MYRGGDTPDFGQTFSNRTHFRACGSFWLSSVQRARTVNDKKVIRLEKVAIDDVLPLKDAHRDAMRFLGPRTPAT